MFKVLIVLIFCINLKCSFGFRCYTCFDEKKSDETLKELKNQGYILPDNPPLCEDGYGEKITCHGHCVKEVKDGKLYRRYCHKDLDPNGILFDCDEKDGLEKCTCDRDLCNGTSSQVDLSLFCCLELKFCIL